ncbi:MAG: hypothetical protein ACYCXR_10655, partial [Coriobacteriia bacterium]
LLSSWQCLLAVDEESTPGSESLITDAVLDLMVGAMATSRQVVYEALCSDLEILAQPAMSAGTTS